MSGFQILLIIFFVVAAGFLATAFVMSASWMRERTNGWEPDRTRWGVHGILLLTGCYRFILYYYLEDEADLFGLSGSTLGITLAAIDAMILGMLVVTLYGLRYMAGPSQHYLASRLTETAHKYRLLAESGSDVIALVRANRTVSYVSPAVTRAFGSEPEAVQALEPDQFLERLVHPDDLLAVGDTLRRQAGTRTIRARMVDRDGGWHWYRVESDPIQEGEAFIGWRVVLRDVQAETEAADDAARRARKQSALAQITRSALENLSMTEVFQEATQVVAETLHVELCAIAELVPDDNLLRLVAGTGWDPGLVGSAIIPTGATDSAAGYTLDHRDTVVVPDFARETRFAESSLLHEHRVASGMSCVVAGPGGTPWGVLAALSTKARDYTPTQVQFLENMAGVLSGTIARHGLDELKQHLITVAAHELKTPITILKGYAQLLKRLPTHGDGVSARGKQHVDQILEETRQLELVIDQLLQVDRARLGLLTVEKSTVDLREVVERAVHRTGFVTGAEERIEIVAPTGSIIGRWDAPRIEQVLINLIDNALKYSRDPVQVRVEPNGTEVCIAIADRGHGLTEFEKGRMFDPFYRSARTRDQASGLGIGLAISKAFVELHGGHIEVQSKIGAGTTITAHLPYQ